MNGTLYVTYDYERSDLEPIFKSGFQFSHIAEADISAAFDDVSADRVEPFEYLLPFSTVRGMNKRYSTEWRCENAHRKTTCSRYPWAFYPKEMHFFDPVQMSILLAHRFGCLCVVCCNSNATISRPSGVQNEIILGNNNSRSHVIGNHCEECAQVDNWSSEYFVEFIAKELRKRKPSGFMERLRNAPPLRVQPMRKRAA